MPHDPILCIFWLTPEDCVRDSCTTPYNWNLRADRPTVSLFFHSIRLVERTLINDNESKAGGWGLQEGNLNVQKGIFRQQTISVASCPLPHWDPPTDAYIFTNALRLSFRKKVLLRASFVCQNRKQLYSRPQFNGNARAVQPNLGPWNRRTL